MRSRLCCASARLGSCDVSTKVPPGNLLTGELSATVQQVSGEFSASSTTLGEPMRYIKLGSTGLDVSPIAIGAMTYGQPDRGHPVWSLGEQDSRPLIKHAIEAGTNFVDTANMYPQCSREEILGLTLPDFTDRDEVAHA